MLAAITTFLSAAITLKPVIASSLAIINARTHHTFLYPSSMKHTRTEITNILSASGSKNFPKFVTKLYFLAIYPSRKSVKHATAYIVSAIYILYGTFSAIIKNIVNGIRITLKIDNLFGKFIL